jgi:hypothetical protein
VRTFARVMTTTALISAAALYVLWVVSFAGLDPTRDLLGGVLRESFAGLGSVVGGTVHVPTTAGVVELARAQWGGTLTVLAVLGALIGSVFTTGQFLWRSAVWTTALVWGSALVLLGLPEIGARVGGDGGAVLVAIAAPAGFAHWLEIAMVAVVAGWGLVGVYVLMAFNSD